MIHAQDDGDQRDFVVIEEAFDPARFREDLLLIEPLFQAPEVQLALPPQPTVADTTPLLVHRVQVIALSRAAGASQVAQLLSRQLNVPVDVVVQGELHAVQAGLFRDAEQAGVLRSRIALLSDDYGGAFVVTDSLTSAVEDRPGFDVLPTDEVNVSRAPTEETPVQLVRTFGWRVLLDQFRDHGEAVSFQRSAMRRLRREDIDVKFTAPYFKVLVGNFRQETDAQRLAERVRAHYRNATKTRGEVFLPKEEINGF
jgi:hypothetical protein